MPLGWMMPPSSSAHRLPLPCPLLCKRLGPPSLTPVARALLPNLDKGKTEFVVSVVGQGSREVRKVLFAPADPGLSIPSRLWPDARVRLVPTYQHLGGFIHHDASLVRELRHRVGLAWKAFISRKKKIFGSPKVSRTDKVVLYESLVLSILLYGAGTWRTLSPSETSILESAYYGMAFYMLRPLCTHEEATHMGGPRVLALLGLPSMHTLLHVAKLRHLLCCVRTSVPILWGMLHWHSEWLRSARDSVAWMWSLVDGGREFATWEGAWTLWLDTCRIAPGRWKGIVRRAQNQALQREKWQAECARNAGLLGRQLQAAGGIVPPQMVAAPPCAHFCAPCRMVFGTYQAWSVHAFKTHGRTMESRHVHLGTQCQSCLKHFTTHVKLCRHLRYSTSCRAKLRGAGYGCVVAPGHGSKKAADPGKFQAPTLQAQGPVLPLEDGPWLDYLERPSIDILECLRLLDYGLSRECCTKDVAWSRVKTAFSASCEPVQRLHCTASAWQLELLEGYCGSFDVSHLLQIAEWVGSADLAAWLVPHPSFQPSGLNTFKDADIILSFLEVDAIPPPVVKPCKEGVLACIGAASWLGASGLLGPASLSFSHEECLDCFRQGEEPSFFQGPFDDVLFAISLKGLPCWADCPKSPVRSKQFLSVLEGATLFGDLVRFALRLWVLGVPACLFLPDCPVSALQPLPGLRFLERTVVRQQPGLILKGTGHLFHSF